MKKISIIAILLFTSSNININAKSIYSDPYACWDLADETLEKFQEENLELHQIATYEQEY